MTRAGPSKVGASLKAKKHHTQHKGKGNAAHVKRQSEKGLGSVHARGAPAEAAVVQDAPGSQAEGAESSLALLATVRFEEDDDELIDDLDLGGESEGEEAEPEPASPKPAVSDPPSPQPNQGSPRGGFPAGTASFRRRGGAGFTDSTRGLQERAAAQSSSRALKSLKGAPEPLGVAHEGSSSRAGSFSRRSSQAESASSRRSERSSGRVGEGGAGVEGSLPGDQAGEVGAGGGQVEVSDEEHGSGSEHLEDSGEAEEAGRDAGQELEDQDVYSDEGSSGESADEALTIEVPDSDDPLALIRVKVDAPNRRKDKKKEIAELFLGDDEHVPKVDDYFAWVPTHVEQCTGFDVRTPFGFYSLFSSSGAHKLMVNMPDMVLVAGGIPVYWMFTSQHGPHKGSILRKLAENSEPAIIRRSFLRSAHADEHNFEHHVAFLQQDANATTVIGPKAFNRLIDALDQERNIGQRIVQKYVKPLKDLGYRTTMTKKGDLMDFNTVTFRMSHAYRPLESQTGVVFPTRKMSAVGSRRKAEPEEVLPAPDGAITNECHKVVQSIMRYMARAWELDLDELVCEFIRSKDYKLVLLRVKNFEWREGQLVQ